MPRHEFVIRVVIAVLREAWAAPGREEDDLDWLRSLQSLVENVGRGDYEAAKINLRWLKKTHPGPT